MSIEACNCARQPAIDADGSDSLPLISAALGLDLDDDCRVAPASFTSERMCAEGHRPAGSTGRRSREELGLASGRGRNQRLVSLLGMLPSKNVRPTGASRRLRPTEYPMFLTKIETQAPTFHNATRWALCRIWATAINTATIRSHRSSCNGRGLTTSAVFAF